MVKPISHAKAFTLVELLVVVAILALLIAILLPSLRKAKFQARVISCSSVLRNIGIAVTSYAAGHNGYYPIPPGVERQEALTDANGNGSVDYNDTKWRRSWALRQDWDAPIGGQKFYDLRPTYQEYLGGKLDKTMRCPLACQYYKDRNPDTDVYKGHYTLSDFMLYITNNWEQSYLRFSKIGANERADITWSTRSYPDYRFTLLASDYVWKTGFDLQTGHPSPEGDYGQIGNATNYAMAYDMKSDLTAPVNFVDGDGSVHTLLVDANSANDTTQWVHSWTGGLKAIVPTLLAR